MGGKTHGPSITADEALEVYLLIGPGRTLGVLEKKLADNPAIKTPPGINCLKRWSQKHSWSAAAKAHDAGVIDKREREARAADESNPWDPAAALKQHAKIILGHVAKELRQLEIKTAQDLATLNQMGIVCLREADALEGVKPLEPAEKKAPEAENVTEGPFPRLPAPEKTSSEKALEALDAMVDGGAPPN